MTAPAKPRGPVADGRRATLRQVAQRAGVSVGAASYALNGRPGVSEATRGRVMMVAQELGWSPNPAARALSSSRANAIGFSLVRPPRSRSVDTYFGPLLGGMEKQASSRDVALVFHLADTEDELVAIYRRWRAGRHVDGVVMLNQVDNDPRLVAVAEIGLPAVLLGGSAALSDISTVSTDIDGITAHIVNYLWTLGHRRISRVAGMQQYLYTQHRDAAFESSLGRLPGGLTSYQVIHTSYSAAEGAAAVRQLMSRPDRPTAIVFDNDVMAASALLTANEMGIRVPEQLSILAWDDSELCTLVKPAITAIGQDPFAQGETAVNVLLDQLDGRGIQHVLLASHELTVRASSAPAG